MIEDADRLSRLDLIKLSDRQLASEIRRRKEIYDGWVETYYKEFIPFAHGMRLFGHFYNDTVKPQTLMSSWTSWEAARWQAWNGTGCSMRWPR